MPTAAGWSTTSRRMTSLRTDRAALPTEEAAHYTGLSYGTRKKRRVTDDGPGYVRIGSRDVHLIDDLDSGLRRHRDAQQHLAHDTDEALGRSGSGGFPHAGSTVVAVSAKESSTPSALV